MNGKINIQVPIALKKTTCKGWKPDSSLAIEFITAKARVAKSMYRIPWDIEAFGEQI